jgi:hypothetical protein
MNTKEKLTMKKRAFGWFLKIGYLILAGFAYFGGGGRCPAEGCPACKLLGK